MTDKSRFGQPIEADTVDPQPLAQGLRGRSQDFLRIALHPLSRELFKNEFPFLFRGAQLQFGFFQAGDVIADARHPHATAVRPRHALPLRRYPGHCAVAAQQPVFRRKLSHGRNGPGHLRLDPGAVFGMDALEELTDLGPCSSAVGLDAIKIREIAVGGKAVCDHIPVPDADAVAGGHRQFQPFGRLGAGTFGKDSVRGFAGDADQPDDVALGVDDGGIGKGPIAFLGEPVAAEIQPHVHHLLAFARQASVHQGRNIVPDAGPQIAEGFAKRVLGPISQNRLIGVVIERDQFRSPGQIHRRGAGQHRAQDGAQIRGPGLHRSHGRIRPVPPGDGAGHPAVAPCQPAAQGAFDIHLSFLIAHRRKVALALRGSCHCSAPIFASACRDRKALKAGR